MQAAPHYDDVVSEVVAFLEERLAFAAGDGFAKLVKEFPTSSRLLEAAMGEASARAAVARDDDTVRLVPALHQRGIRRLQLSRQGAVDPDFGIIVHVHRQHRLCRRRGGPPDGKVQPGGRAARAA